MEMVTRHRTALLGPKNAETGMISEADFYGKEI
jgi:hypothetical protein